MTFAAIDWLNISINLLLVLFFIVCIMMVLIILMQRPKQEGLGAAFGTNVTDQVFGARTTNVLQRGTVYLGSLFFILSLALAILIGHRNKSHSLIDKTAVHAPPVIEATPPAPDKPLIEQAKAAGQTIPATVSPTPATEPAPEVPAPAPEAPTAPVETPAQPEAPKPEEPAPPAEQPAPPAGGEKPAGQ